MAGLFDIKYHEREIKEYQAPLSKSDKETLKMIIQIQREKL